MFVVLGPVVLAGVIAAKTRPNAFPDEFIHIDAFEYFHSHWLRPKPGSTEVAYSINGISRVFNGEIVYLLFGKVGYFPRRIWPKVNPYYVYRYCNVGLLLITLTWLVFIRCKWFAPWLLALFMVCIPQVVCLYSYANSDAFGVSASVLLFAHLASMLDESPRRWGAVRISIFMLLFLCTLLSKIAFEMGILLPLALLVIHLIRTRTSLKWILPRLVPPLLLVYALAAWWNPQLSPWRVGWQKQMMAVRVERGIVGRRPGDPQAAFGGNYPVAFSGLYPAANHVTLRQILTVDHYAWFKFNGQSFYGRFGYMTVILPAWIYAAVGYTALALLLMTLLAVCVYKNRMTWQTIVCIISALGLIAFNLFGSMFHSLYYDWQPQGRYLFASLVPIFFLCLGMWMNEGRWWRILHGLVLLMLVSLSGYVLIAYAVMSPILRGQ